MCSGTDAYAAIIPDCAGAVEIDKAKVVRVEKNGVLVLEDGRAVILEGIRLPEQDSQRQEALSALRVLTAGKSITFTAIAPKQDRYDRIRAQGFTDVWLQNALLDKGLARVAIAPDRNECAPDLYEVEARAREHQAGLWALSANAPRRAEAFHEPPRAEAAPRPVDAAPETRRRTDVAREAGSFQLVEGWVTHVASGGGRTFIDFGSDGRQSFSAVIQPEDRRAFRGFDLEALEAHKIRIRGIVQDYRGRPEIALSNPAQIEVLN
jgi:endonuclease YncB( thermonuclease family)